MKTRSGYETNGDYIKFKSGFTGKIAVETSDKIEYFNDEEDAQMYIVTQVLTCEIGYKVCPKFRDQNEGCYKCKFGTNKNVVP